MSTEPIKEAEFLQDSNLIRGAKMSASRSHADVVKFLKSIDYDKSGTVNARELYAAFKDEMTIAEIKDFVARYDKNGDGELDIKELIEFFSKPKQTL